MSSWLVAASTLLSVAALPGADTLHLPTPEAARVQQAKLITAVGGRPDRLLASHVPGAVRNDELVRVSLGPDGSVQGVLVDQRLSLSGAGDYAIRERGPARSASSLSTEPAPVTRRGAVVWQGFSPGRRELAARLTLDPQIESTRLPLSVAVRFKPARGPARELGPTGLIPAAGRVSITITDQTAQPADLPSAQDVSPAAIAVLLDQSLHVARHPSSGRLPTTAAGLPATLAVTGALTAASVQAVPYRLSGSLHLNGTTGSVSGPAMAPDGTFTGTLGGSRPGHTSASVTFEAQATGPGRLVLDLTAVSALNPAELSPPVGFTSWHGWAASRPALTQRRAALDLLVAVAATGARASSYGPYLGADLAGTGSTTFRYGFEPRHSAAPSQAPLHPQWGAIAVVALALLLLCAAAAAVWRRS